MKLWQKIYIFSMVLLMLTLNIGGVALIQKIHNDLLQKEVKKCIGELKYISTGLMVNSVLEQKEKESSNLSIREYAKLLGTGDDRIGYIEILDDKNKVVYTNVNFHMPTNRKELSGLYRAANNYIIRKIEGKDYLFVSSRTLLYQNFFKICYIKNISNIYSEKMNYYSFFAKVDICIFIVFGICMFFISKLITKPVNRLIISTQKIANGNYSERADVRSKDEFNILSHNFNLMASTVEDKIRELQAANVEKEIFINNLTHELKTPLTSIIGYANIIRTSKYNEELFYDASDYIYREGKRLEQLAFKMMDLIYVKEQELDISDESILAIAEDVKKDLHAKLKEKGVELIIEGEDITASYDRELMRILLCNLVDNAIKASKKESNVYIKTKKVDGGMSISIVDAGIGIPKEHLDKIGQAFYVVDKSRSRKNNGAGIGFSICKRITEKHGGSINIESEVNKGTKVTVIIPINPSMEVLA